MFDLIINFCDTAECELIALLIQFIATCDDRARIFTLLSNSNTTCFLGSKQMASLIKETLNKS